MPVIEEYGRFRSPDCRDHISGLRDVLSFVVMVSNESFLV